MGRSTFFEFSTGFLFSFYVFNGVVSPEDTLVRKSIPKEVDKEILRISSIKEMERKHINRQQEVSSKSRNNGTSAKEPSSKEAKYISKELFTHEVSWSGMVEQYRDKTIKMLNRLFQNLPKED